MQSIVKVTVFFAALFILAACGGSEKNDLTEKKQRLEELRKQQAATNTEIEALQKEIAKLDNGSPLADNPKLVVLDTLNKESFSHFIELRGKVDANDISYVSPRGGGGQVRAVYVREGEVVRKGQLLLKLDDAIIKQNVAAARQAMAATRNQLELAKNVYQRTKNLWDQHIGTEVQLLQAKTNVEVLENQLKTQQENLKAAQEQLATTNVVSSVSGVAEEVNVHPGELFTGAPNAGIKIVNTSNLKVVTEVPENYLSRVNKGTPVVISIPDINKTYNSVISLVSQSISATSRSFVAEAKIPADRTLKPNLTATVRIQDYSTPNAITIPVNVLQTDEQGKFVLVAEKTGDRWVAKKRPVKVGELYGERLEVTAGLQSGDVIITEGFQNLYDGQSITTA